MKENRMLAIGAALLLSCSSSSTQETNSAADPIGGDSQPSLIWSIPIEQVLDGGPGRDGIPALENPTMVSADNASILADTDLVLGYKNGNDIRAYQHIILDWHEIINDNIGETSMAVTYCPLTGTGIGWNRIVNGQETTFGVSGLLYQTNLIPFDRATLSNWSQILNEAVNGSSLGEKADLIPLVETDWKTWRTMYPLTKIVSLNTGFSRTYGVYPYIDYKTNNDFFLFPTPKDARLPLKVRVHAIIDERKAKAYRFHDFEEGNIILDTFNGKDYLVVGNSSFIVSFVLEAEQKTIDYTYIFNGIDGALLQDANGNQYDIFGEILVGDVKALQPTSSFMAYWFSVPAFYETEIFGK